MRRRRIHPYRSYPARRGYPAHPAYPAHPHRGYPARFGLGSTEIAVFEWREAAQAMIEKQAGAKRAFVAAWVEGLPRPQREAAKLSACIREGDRLRKVTPPLMRNDTQALSLGYKLDESTRHAQALFNAKSLQELKLLVDEMPAESSGVLPSPLLPVDTSTGSGARHGDSVVRSAAVGAVVGAVVGYFAGVSLGKSALTGGCLAGGYTALTSSRLETKHGVLLEE